jgi:hypothetical protein
MEAASPPDLGGFKLPFQSSKNWYQVGQDSFLSIHKLCRSLISQPHKVVMARGGASERLFPRSNLGLLGSI